ncbi:hypothetical protein QOZ80_UnG0724110 [Eleusine coracana subsp. coracana]|uniref:DUF4219 domain-containing protein n=1 Tax=Eleusine coracana subsp. coracana TaxID=191504 RepID=A0AAV9FY38_ELECO|nr:hypothetical protein QOZ80_UnG0724110 [Eleusine coracana subsp. coracana]
MPGPAESVPIFNGEDYGYWKALMQGYLQSLDPEIWMVTHESDADVNLLEPDYIKCNAKAKNALFACISKDVFPQLDASSSAYGIWTEIQGLYEGTSDVKEERHYVLKNKYDNFTRLPHERANTVHSRFHVLVEEINARGDDFKMKHVEVIRRFLRLFKDSKYESIITFILQGDLKTKTMKDVLGKITAFESYQLGLDDPQPSNLALPADKQESSKSKKNKKKVIIEDDDEEDDDEGDLIEDLTLLMKKMKNFKNKFASKSREEEEDPKAKHKKKRFLDKSKGKDKAQGYKKKFSCKALVGEWTSDNSYDESSSSSDEEVAGLAMIKTTPTRAIPPPLTCLMAMSQLRESEDESSVDSNDEELSCVQLWSMLEQARNIAIKKSKMLDVVRKECKLAKDHVGELESELEDLVTSHEALNKSYDKLKGDHVELHEKYKALEITFEAINVENLASLSPSSSKSDACTMCDELTTLVEVSSLEPLDLKELHKPKEEREMMM